MAAGAALGPAVLLVPEALVKRITEAQLTSLTRITAICMALGVAEKLGELVERGVGQALEELRLAKAVADGGGGHSG